ncbi:MAG: M13 family metallopeptidase [Acidobacteriia bacterium]|nr:M13 family metallopeptidase [Terriglobia bacterium]
MRYWLCVAGLLACSLALATPAGSLAEAGFDPANLDRTCKPCDNFNRFASGGWMARNPIPAAYPSWGSFNVLAENNRAQLKAILEDAAKAAAPKGSNEQKIGDYYASCMDEPAIEAAGLKPLADELDRIAAIPDTAGLREEVLRLQGYGVDAPFRLDSTQDFQDSTQVIGEVDQAGLGLPDRDYYTREDAKSQQLRDEYVKHVARMFGLMGDDAAKAEAEAKTVMEIETQLAKASLTNVERRDPHALYHRMGVAQIKALAPAFSWDDYLTHANLAGKGDLNVATPDFFKEVNRLLSAVSLADWKTYLRWHLISAAAPRLSTKFVDEDFNFNGKTLTGTQEILPRWKRCVRATDHALGEALGQAYVAKHFPPQAKARALEMVHNLEAALREDIQNLPWMGPETKKQALTKLDAIVNKIGYPDKWRDYSKLEIDRGPYVLNAFHAEHFEFNRDLAKVGKPVDRTEWGMSPPTVNAYYNPQLNEIVFPAGILQPPFYSPDADDAINYGGIGAVIGHELTHGFDDEGSQFDAQGNLRNWWTPEDRKNFEARAACIVKQFDGFEVEPGLHQNGKLVEGESIADLGGLNIAYRAYEKSLEGKPRPPVIEGFTPQQRFFLGWAQVWADNMRPEFARLLTNTDPHALARFRVEAPLSNLPAFAEAFSCKPGDAEVRPANERCAIW